ncbi:MAG: prepilin-type N-terminal cleavage/methylation domain-containing protein [Phycisphaerae bacterium]|nr:prepilin-type N-terminal cleavage/methylation domain-containing protein [Phycisphaerae bacterium]
MTGAEKRRQKSEDRSQDAGTPGRFRSSSRPGSPPVSCLLSPVFRAAFSLLELMIAIVILGIGMVMVATVFPIGIDMAAQTVQMNIAQAVADVALGTLQLKVPRWPNKVPGPALKAAPDVLRTEFGSATDPVEIDVSDQTALGLNGHFTTIWDISAMTADVEVVKRLRFFTETTGWTAEKGPSGPGDAWDYAYVIPSQNLPPAYANIASINSLPPAIPPTLGRVPDVYPLNLIDQVYPPVQRTRADGSSRDFLDSATETGIRSDLAGRRYSWIAIHHLTDSNAGGSRFVVTLLVTYRSNLANRYARQADADSDPSVYAPVFNPDPDLNTLNAPVPDAEDTDMLFPRPWLVRFNQVNLGTGEVRCMKAVADLLPTGSYFVAARSMYAFPNNVPQLAIAAGAAYEVLSRQGDLGNPVWTLQIRRQRPIDNVVWVPGDANNLKDPREVLYAWVIPPAIERSGKTYSFQAKSPVAGVFMRMVE